MQIDKDDGRCFQCGHCCKTAACPFGVWDYEKKQCQFLDGDTPGFYVCRKYKEIKAINLKNAESLDVPSSFFSPAFGAGCSSTLFNGDRQRAIGNLRKKPDVTPPLVT